MRFSLVGVNVAVWETMEPLDGLSREKSRVGLIPDPGEKHDGPSLEEQLAEALRKERGESA